MFKKDKAKKSGGKRKRNGKAKKEKKCKDKGKVWINGECKKPKQGRKLPNALRKDVYNQMWCADLAIEEALRECARQKIAY